MCASQFRGGCCPAAAETACVRRTPEPDPGNAGVGIAPKAGIRCVRDFRALNFSSGGVLVKKRFSVRVLCEGALLVAMAQGLGYLKLWEFPQGGSVTAAMLPIAVFAWRRGVRAGLLGGFVFGLLQLLLDGAYAWGWQSMLGDYLLAFTPLGLGGVFCGRKYGLPCAVILGAFGRFLVHWVTGATVWADTMPETFFSPWVYSFVYNGTYVGLSALLCLVLACLLMKPLSRIPTK